MLYTGQPQCVPGGRDCLPPGVCISRVRTRRRVSTAHHASALAPQPTTTERLRAAVAAPAAHATPSASDQAQPVAAGPLRFSAADPEETSHAVLWPMADISQVAAQLASLSDDQLPTSLQEAEQQVPPQYLAQEQGLAHDDTAAALPSWLALLQRVSAAQLHLGPRLQMLVFTSVAQAVDSQQAELQEPQLVELAAALAALSEPPRTSRAGTPGPAGPQPAPAQAAVAVPRHTLHAARQRALCSVLGALTPHLSQTQSQSQPHTEGVTEDSSDVLLVRYLPVLRGLALSPVTTQLPASFTHALITCLTEQLKAYSETYAAASTSRRGSVSQHSGRPRGKHRQGNDRQGGLAPAVAQQLLWAVSRLVTRQQMQPPSPELMQVGGRICLYPCCI